MPRYRPTLMAVVIASALPALPAAAPAGASAKGAGEKANPCLTESGRRNLRCPDLRMRDPFDMWISRPGRMVLLHAANDIKNRGTGPLEVRGRRTSARFMRARQAIYRRDGSVYLRPPTGVLDFHYIPGQGRYWKYMYAAQFEIWTLNGSRKRERRVRVGPKLSYCFRDLARTRPSPRSPEGAVYPACSQLSSLSEVWLGTSVGWSDIYPSGYDKNWINVKGLRGCFMFRQVADPRNQLAESNEANNSGAVRVKLPPGRRSVASC